MSPLDLEAFAKASSFLTPLLIGIIGWFLRSAARNHDSAISHMQRALTDLDKTLAMARRDIEILTDTLSSLKDVRDEWLSMKKDVAQIMRELNDLRSLERQVDMVKGDQVVIWRAIDELKEEFRNN